MLATIANAIAILPITAVTVEPTRLAIDDWLD
jgi:hypothetical protein